MLSKGRLDPSGRLGSGLTLHPTPHLLLTGSEVLGRINMQDPRWSQRPAPGPEHWLSIQISWLGGLNVLKGKNACILLAAGRLYFAKLESFKVVVKVGGELMWVREIRVESMLPCSS